MPYARPNSIRYNDRGVYILTETNCRPPTIEEMERAVERIRGEAELYSSFWGPNLTLSNFNFDTSVKEWPSNSSRASKFGLSLLPIPEEIILCFFEGKELKHGIFETKTYMNGMVLQKGGTDIVTSYNDSKTMGFSSKEVALEITGNPDLSQPFTCPEKFKKHPTP